MKNPGKTWEYLFKKIYPGIWGFRFPQGNCPR